VEGSPGWYAANILWWKLICIGNIY
jgi:hypothetical protein